MSCTFHYADSGQTCEESGYRTPATQEECYAGVGTLTWPQNNLVLSMTKTYNQRQCNTYNTSPMCKQSGISIYWNNFFNRDPQPSDGTQICISNCDPTGTI